MNKHSKYRPLMDDIQDKICNAEIGVTGLYRLMLETLDEAEQELATLKASLPKIKADAVLNYAKNMERVEQAANLKMEQGLRMMASFAKKTAEEYANKLEAGE